MTHHRGLLSVIFLLAFVVTGCVDSSGRAITASAQSCMTCHNGSVDNNYGGPGLENPHPFTGASNLLCTTCHGGNPNGTDRASSHVPAPPEIGDRQNWINNDHAYFNRLTLAGPDKFPDYTAANGQTYSALDWLQFVSPADIRVVTQNRSCGQCHANHAQIVSQSPIATEMGIFSGAMFAAGVDNQMGYTGYEDTAADLGIRAVTDQSFDPTTFGSVQNLMEFPVYSRRFNNGPNDIRNNPDFDAAELDDDIDPLTGQAITDSPLAKLYHEQIAYTCGDCHLGSAGANNRYGDYRGSGCSACHMRHSLSGRSTSNDPNLNRMEPYDPDDIDEPELPHVARHLIRTVAKTLSSGEFVQGIDDYACAGCHQGSNRTVMQYWGIRLDQNQDVRRGFQYPSQPGSYRTTSGDTRLFDPNLPIYDQNGVLIRLGNREFNGRNRNQYLLEEDYDDDGRDDTPPDVHYEAGMGCIDCHGSFDLHGGDVTSPSGGKIVSRMEHAVGIRCESCHGGVAAYAQTAQGTAYDNTTQELAVDGEGNTLAHVVLESDGHFYLYSRLTGARHFVPQTLDVTVNTGRTHPFSGAPLYSDKASYAMGRDDGLGTTGIGPIQANNAVPSNFSHTDDLDCASCHASWTNTCMGCHLKGEYSNDFSNITGERIVFEEDEAEFVYQSPVFMALGISPHNEITQVSSNTKMFFQWEDRNNQLSSIFTFSDRKAQGSDPNQTPSLGHNAMMAHSIRGRVTSTMEGPRYCVACHITEAGMQQYGTEYVAFRSAMASGSYDQLDFTELRQHFGQNSGNQMNSPFWVHMVAGLGTGLFLFDGNGGAINPLDQNPNRYGIFADPGIQNVTVAPATAFDPATFMTRIAYNLDSIVLADGTPTSSSNHPLMPGTGPSLRAGTPNPTMAGPLTGTMIDRLTNPDPAFGIHLDSWLDANGNIGGNAGNYVSGP